MGEHERPLDSMIMILKYVDSIYGHKGRQFAN